MRILYVRHGESTANIRGIAGTTDAVLTDKGIAQAHTIGQHLRTQGVVTIFSSPYIRAQQTAEIIAAELGLPAKDIITIDELRERFMGELEGTSGVKPVSFFLSNEGKEYGMEPRQAILDRLSAAIEKMKAITRERGGTTIAVAHGTVGYHITQMALGHTRLEDFDPPEEMHNTGFVEIWNSIDPAKPTVVVDVDGVLFETPIDAVAAANKAHGTKHHVSDIFNYNAEHNKEKFVVNGEDQFHKFQHNTLQYRQVKGVRKALERLAKRANIVALTSRQYDPFADATRQVIYKHFGDLIADVYFTTEPSGDKHREKGAIVKELGGTLLVDDAVKYCESALAHGVPAVLIPQPYNQSGHNYAPDYRAADWDDAVRIIERELDRQPSN